MAAESDTTALLKVSEQPLAIEATDKINPTVQMLCKYISILAQQIVYIY